MDPIITGSIISGISALAGGAASAAGSGGRQSREARRMMNLTIPTVGLQQMYLQDLLKGYGAPGGGYDPGQTMGRSGSPLVNMINQALAGNYGVDTDIAGTGEYKSLMDIINRNYEQESGSILNQLAARGSIRSGSTQLALEKLGVGKMNLQNKAYLDVYTDRSNRIQQAVKEAIGIIMGSPNPSMIAATGSVGGSMLEQALKSSGEAGAGIAGFGRNIGSSMAINEILDRYYGRRDRNPNTGSNRPDSSFLDRFFT